jgi:hypothetical protein
MMVPRLSLRTGRPQLFRRDPSDVLPLPHIHLWRNASNGPQATNLAHLHTISEGVAYLVPPRLHGWSDICSPATTEGLQSRATLTLSSPLRVPASQLRPPCLASRRTQLRTAEVTPSFSSSSALPHLRSPLLPAPSPEPDVLPPKTAYYASERRNLRRILHVAKLHTARAPFYPTVLLLSGY